MRNAEEFSGRRPGLARMPWAYRRPGRGAGGRRAGSGTPTAAHCRASSRTARCHRVRRVTTGAIWARESPGTSRAPPTRAPGPGWASGHGAWLAEPGTGAWLAEPPVGGRHGDLWVLVCGGIAAAAAFGAAFVASGGVASHPAAPGATMPAVVSQACPSPAPGPTP